MSNHPTATPPHDGRGDTKRSTVPPTSGAAGAIGTSPKSSPNLAAQTPLSASPSPTSPTTGKGTPVTNSDTLNATLPASASSPINISGELAALLSPPAVTVTQFDPAALNERRAAIAKGQRADLLRRLYESANAPELHTEQSKRGLMPHPEWDQARRQVLDVVTKPGAGILLALIGTPGSGKTQIGVEAMRAHLLAHGKPIRYEVLADLFAICREAYGKKATRTEMQILRDFTSPALLVIDEIDKRGGTPSEQNLLHRVLDKRYRSLNRPTLLIGNVDSAEKLGEVLDGFAGHGIGPLFDRLRHKGGIVEASGWNFRQEAGRV